MAEGAIVKYVLDKLGDPLLKEVLDMYHVNRQIRLMQQELCLIQDLLRDADSKRNRDVLVKRWLNLVRDISYRIEDMIDIFLVEIQKNPPKSSDWFSKLGMVVKNPIKIYKLNAELKKITKNLRILYQRRTDLEITVLGAGSEENGQQPLRPTRPSHVDDKKVVGLQGDTCHIIKQLLDINISRRTVLSIVGTGGLGKTTLAQKVYKSVELERHFHCRAWLSISKKYNLQDLLREILFSIEPRMRQQNPPMTVDDLTVNLKSSLRGKRYLIILDDVWTKNLWEQFQKALPDLNNASRVIITSRSLAVALAADCKTVPYKLSYLNDDDSLALLFRNALQEHIEPEKYPPDLLEVATRLTRKCGGLPLALVVLGGILTYRKPTFNAWSKVEETMDWHNEDGEQCMKILAMSYEDLPYYLKPCFLYFASFPEDYQISGKHVTKMWVAEGFIPNDGAVLMEDKAEECLEELVQRSLIQVNKKRWNGYCKYCNMHDLLRDLAIHEAKEENFFTVFSKTEEDVNQLAAKKPRRAALQFCNVKEDDVYSENTRSLICFGFLGSRDLELLNFSGFRLLRLLTLENVFMSYLEIKGLIHLRYLSFRGCTFSCEIFENNSFYNLQTIEYYGDITGNYPSRTFVIPTLRHLCGSQMERTCPLKWNLHTNLQTLKFVGHGVVPELECCINLRTLGISYCKWDTSNERDLNPLKEWQILKGVLSRMEQLVSLSLKTEFSDDLQVPFGGTKDLPCHGKIQKLYLKGKWGTNIFVPRVEMFPTNLTKLTLESSELEEDPMPILERLQSLRILHLESHSYEGRKLICSTRGFPNLEKLKLRILPNLCHWDIKEKAMPILTHLEINNCDKLHALPELQKVRTLQELLVINPSRELRESMEGKDLHKVEHIPSVGISG